jgi:uncharacterized protein YjdB
MKKIHKATLAAIGAGILGLGLLAGVWTGCTLPVLAGDGEGGAAAAPGKGSGTDITGEVGFDEDGTGVVTFTVPWAASARSLAGADTDIIKSTGRGIRNIYQLIAVDDSDPGTVWGFTEARGSGALKVNILKGHTYHFLFLGGHLERDWAVNNGVPATPGTGNGLEADGTIAYKFPPTLLASGYLKATMSLETSANMLSLIMTPLVVDTAFVKNPGGEARYSGRMAKTVGLDENTGYTFRVTLGGKEDGVVATDVALKAASENGLAPLVNAEAGVKGGVAYWGDLSLLSNTAWFDTAPLGDYHDTNKTPDSTGTHTARKTGVAEYLFITPGANSATVGAYFKMEYAPFGLPDSAWGVNGGVKPVWVIRNGLNDLKQDAFTDFAAWTEGASSNIPLHWIGNYDTPPTAGAVNDAYTSNLDGLWYVWDGSKWEELTWTAVANINGALSVGVVNPNASPHPWGIFEDNNPWPIAGTEWAPDKPDDYLDTWLNVDMMRDALQTGRGKYGVYTLYDRKTPEGEVIVSGGRAVTGVSLNKLSMPLLVGNTETLAATVLPSSAGNKAVTWSTSNQAIATVSPGGEVTGIADGTALIEVWTVDGSKTAGCTVTVSSVPVPVTGVSLNKGTTSILVGKTETLTATVAPLNATNQAVTWSSDKPGIATVSQSGGVKGIAEGEATITVTTTDGNKEESCTVTVTLTAVPVTGVSLDKGATVIAVGATETLVATVLPAAATNQAVTWYSSNQTVAYVSQGGAVKGLAAGEAIIEVRTMEGNKTATCTVTVPSVTVSPASAGVSKGGAQQFIAAVSGISDKTVTWTIVEAHNSGTTITGGLLKVAAVETANSLTVKATSTVNTAVSGTATVTVSSDGSGMAGGGEPGW